jgi:hypothetical protein
LHSNYLLKYATEGKRGGRTEVRGGRRKRLKQLLDGLKEKRGYCKLKGETVHRFLWGTDFGISCGSVERQTKV